MRSRFQIAALVLLGCIPGCQQAQLTSGAYEVDAPRAALFKDGPAQRTGPDVSLSRGDRVTVLRTERGYSVVRLADGREGYVASTSLRALPVPKVPDSAPRSARVKPAITAPTPETLPVSDNALFGPAREGDTPKPRFRF